MYAHANGIFNMAERNKRPLHTIAMHEAEENGVNSELFDAMKLFRDNQVLKHFGINWTEALQLTHEEFTYIMELSAEATKKEAANSNTVLNQMQNDLNNLKGQPKK